MKSIQVKMQSGPRNRCMLFDLVENLSESKRSQILAIDSYYSNWLKTCPSQNVAKSSQSMHVIRLG